MLTNLHVKNLALIDEAEINFENGLNILTGETGAGKSIVLGSVNIALGGKVSADIIRKGTDYALTELVFHIEEPEKLRVLEEMDIEELEEGTVIISRKITPSRSQMKVNGMNCTVSQVRAIAAQLIDIHGQHDNQLLLHESRHLDMVDAFGAEKILPVREAYRQAYKEYARMSAELEQMDTDEESRQREISFIEYEVNEIRQAELKAGEDEELEARFRRMSNMQRIMEDIAFADQMLSSGEENVRDGLSMVLKSVLSAAAYDNALTDAADTLSDAEQLLSEAGRAIADYAQRSDSFDESEFIQVQQRLDRINSFKMKYGKTIDAVLAYEKAQQEKLTQLYDYDQVLEKLRSEMETCRHQMEQIAAQLTALRKETAQKLCAQIAEALSELNFLNTEFAAEFEEASQFLQNGRDVMRFMISTNVGETLKPLSRIASGGELSRIMLAVKTVIADQDDLETLIFDEIDAGISGRTAQLVAEKLNELARMHQIICITHLPQIASMADEHYLIEKTVASETTTTAINRLSEEESVMELARLLGGSKITDTVISNAREMREMAVKQKK